jgi:EpsI family protein
MLSYAGLVVPRQGWHEIRRHWTVPVLLVASAGLLQARHKIELIPNHLPVSSFPIQVGNWRGQDQQISDAILAVLGPGDFLSRVYLQPGQPSLGFFLAYFPSQQTGDTIHSPKNCLPGAGWMPVESSRIWLPASDGKTIPANRYIIQNGTERQIVLYWYLAHGRAVASEYWARFYLVADAIRMNRTDGALIRIITPIEHGENSEAAEQRAVNFAQQILPSLNEYVPL